LVAATLTGTSLAGADLSGADLSGAYLTRVDVSAASLSGTLLQGARGVGLSGVPVAMPTAWSITSGYLVGPSADLGGARLDDVDLTGRDLSGAALVGASLVRTDLAGADLRYALLLGANLLDADISAGTNLSSAALAGVRSGSVDGVTALVPAGWSFARGYLVGPSADLALADLAGARLRGADLSGAGLRLADLSGADLTGADLRGAHAESSRAVGTDFDGAQLDGSTWRSATLLGASLRGASVAQADLSDAGLSRADLTGATGLALAATSGVLWHDTLCPDGRRGDAHLGASCLQPLDTAPPTVRLGALPEVSAPSGSPYLRVTGTTIDAGSGVWSTRVRWQSRPLGTSAWSAYTSGPTWGGSSWADYVPVRPGYHYCVTAEAVDVAGNASRGLTRACTTMPFDDDALLAAGAWSRDPSAAGPWYRSSRSTATARGASLTTRSRLSVRQVGVVARTCARCGVVDVYVGATRVGRISLVSPRTTYRAQRVIQLQRPLTGKVRLVVASSGRQVAIDGLIA
jgi:uncharacterized protein YjbI with pentapeptide repeats